MNTTENNRLIAEFMGFGLDEKEGLHWIDTDEKFGHETSELKYDSSWDWLMPVVEKIEKTEIEGDFPVVTISQGLCEAENVGGFNMWLREERNLYPYFQGTKIEATYQFVVEFIKWYNQQKK